MNLKFWKKKKTPEESDNSAANATLVATEAASVPAKPGFWTRLKTTLSPSRKKSQPVEAEPSARRKNDKHQSEESEAPPPKPGFLARIKSVLLPSRKNDKIEDAEKPGERKSSAKQPSKKHPNEEPEPSDLPTKKSRKKLVIALALLVPLVAGGGFFAVSKFLPPPPHQEAPPAKVAASQEVKDGQPAPEPTEAAEHAQQSKPEQPPAEPAPQQADNSATLATEAAEPPAETPIADAPAPADEDVQAQIKALKKQNQEMQAQIEALKKQPAVEKPARFTATTTPREGVLIINGKDTKESVQGLKKVIEGMNGTSNAKDTGKK
jgi:cell division protein FtsB